MTDKVTVDEPLISTDVDRLIRAIADKKKVALKDLRHTCNIDKKNMDKWISVLEEEGYITVKYGLGGTYVLWKGLEEESESEESYPTDVPEPESVIADYEPENIVEEKPAGDEEKPFEQEENPQREEPKQEENPGEENSDDDEKKEESFPVEMPLAEPMEPEEEKPEADPEELLSKYVEKKIEGNLSSADDIKSSILTNLEDSNPGYEQPETDSRPDEETVEEPENPGPEEEIVHETEEELVNEPDEGPEPPKAPEPPDEPEDPEDPDVDDVVYGEKEEVFTPPTLKPLGRDKPVVPAGDVRELMATYLEEINREKAKISELRKERDSLYREKLATLEGKMQADVTTFTEKILDKQSRLAQIKESVLELPDKIDEVEKLQEQMAELRNEGREALSRTRQRAESYLSSIEASKEELKSKIENLDSSIEEQSDRMDELEDVSSSLDERSEKLKESIEAARAQVDELNSSMATLSADVQKLQESKTEIENMKQEITESVAAHSGELDSLTQELEGISHVEHWVQEYVRDYESKIGEIEDYISNSDKEMVELRESAESHYMKKYISELENIASEYESQFEDALAREKTIDQKISESKARITELARESQDIIKKLRGEASDSPDFDSTLARVKERTAEVKRTVEEKQGERRKLKEDAGTTRKRKRTKAVAKKKPKSRKKKKK